MLEVVIPGVRYGEGKILADSAYVGSHVYIAGIAADGTQQLKLPYSSVQAIAARYPINKYYFAEDYNDTSDAVNKMDNGDTVIYYDGGEYITDRFNAASFGLTAAYWNGVESGKSTAFSGRQPYSNPGSSTAAGTTGLDKIYVGYGTDATNGNLYGTTASGRGSAVLTQTTDYIGFVVGMYYEDSANPRLRYRIAPSVNLGTGKNLF